MKRISEAPRSQKDRTRRLVECTWISPTAAARELGVGRSRMYQLLKAGVISSGLVGNKLVVPLQAVHDYKQTVLRIGSVA
jgi:excisionase family DNA binding protein